MTEHVHLCLSIPPKYGVANTVGRIKGEPVVRIHRDYIVKRGSSKGFHFWTTGYCVSTVGLDKEKIRNNNLKQEEKDRQLEQSDLFEKLKWNGGF